MTFKQWNCTTRTRHCNVAIKFIIYASPICVMGINCTTINIFCFITFKLWTCTSYRINWWFLLHCYNVYYIFSRLPNHHSIQTHFPSIYIFLTKPSRCQHCIGLQFFSQLMIMYLYPMSKCPCYPHSRISIHWVPWMVLQ